MPAALMPALPDEAAPAAVEAARREALDALIPLLYEPLRCLARRHLRRERAGHPLCAAALVHEAYLKLAEIRRVPWHDRAHVLAMASRVMRRILIDEAHRRAASKRGGGWQRVAYAETLHVPDSYAEAVVEVGEAMRQLAARQPRQGQILEYHFFLGMTLEEIGAVLGVSRSTIKRELRRARAWLARRLAPGRLSTP